MYERKSPIHSRFIEDGGRLLETFDDEKALQEFSKQAKEAGERIDGILKREDLNEGTKAQLNSFIATYLDESGNANPEAIKHLVSFLKSKIDIVSLKDLQETAEAIAGSADGKEVLLFIPDNKAREADFSSPESENSNEFMAKLVRQYMKKAGNEPKIVGQEVLSSDKKTINIVDDSIYSGEQLKSLFSQLVRQIRNPIKIVLSVARSTDAGLKKIQEEALKNPNITLEVRAGKKISTIADIKSEDPEVYEFFLTTGMLSVLESGDSDEAARSYAQNYLTSTTLTISDVKTPDFQSFPSRLASGFKRGTNDNAYPAIPV